MIKFTTFAKAVDCIDKGGAARRYGVYPIYCKNSVGTVTAQYATNQMNSVGFTLDEQKAQDWVLISPKVHKANQKKQQEYWAQYWAQQVKPDLEANTPPIEVTTSSNADLIDNRPVFIKFLDWLMPHRTQHDR